jgi:hypothetical protein
MAGSGYFAGGLAKALSSLPSDIVAFKNAESMDKYRTGLLDVEKNKNALAKNKSLVEQYNKQIDALYKVGQDTVAAAVQAGTWPDDPQKRVQLLQPILGTAMQNAMMLEATGLSANAGEIVKQRFGSLLGTPTAAQAAKTAGTAEGTKAVAATEATASGLGASVGDVARAKGELPRANLATLFNPATEKLITIDVGRNPNDAQALLDQGWIEATGATKPGKTTIQDIVVPLLQKVQTEGVDALTDKEWATMELAARSTTGVDVYVNKLAREALSEKSKTIPQDVAKQFDAERPSLKVPEGAKLSGITKKEADRSGKEVTKYEIIDKSGKPIFWWYPAGAS